ncbi:MAG: choice-of-anchor V domain-containing protein [Acidobacteriota bacterium]
MLKRSVKQKLQTLILVLAISVIAYASVTGPDPGYTNALGDINSCVQCHDTFVNHDVGPGTVTITGVPAIYQPGQQYILTVRVQQSGRAKFGFQMTVIDSNRNRAGTLAPVNSETQLNFQTGPGGRQYIQHTQAGTNPNAGNARTWQVNWTAPTTDIGTIIFNVAGNAANGDGTNQGDYIYTAKVFSESATSNVTVAFADPLITGQTLNAGSTFRINWTTTGKSNIASIELRYSTDDGATFPGGAPNQVIINTTDPNVSSFDWVVPNVSTTLAKIRIQATNKSNLATEVISGRFTIQGSGGGGTQTKPVITSIVQKGNKLNVFGSNFQVGSLVMVNDREFASFNLEPPTEALRSKKAGKNIAPGQTVEIKVKNPDGQISEGMMHTRPPE